MSAQLCIRGYETDQGNAALRKTGRRERQTLISTGGASIALQLTRSCSFSMKTNVRIVCGLTGQSQRWKPLISQGGSATHVRRSQAGVQPFIKNRGPSLRRPWVVIWRRL